jgi:hypothetical protein
VFYNGIDVIMSLALGLPVHNVAISDDELGQVASSEVK